jgi:acetolactate synthase-1/3 small subunit
MLAPGPDGASLALGVPLRIRRDAAYKRGEVTTGPHPMTDPQPASVYDLSPSTEAESLATFAVLVDDEPGVLHRLVGLFAARGYNIESLTVAGVDPQAHTSRVTIVTRGTPQVLGQIQAQLEKMVAARHVQDVTRDPNGLERELALVKVKGTGAERAEALRVADIFRARVIDITRESFVFELTGAPSKIDKFTGLMRDLGLVEVSRTGVLSIQRGVDGF